MADAMGTAGVRQQARPASGAQNTKRQRHRRKSVKLSRRTKAQHKRYSPYLLPLSLLNCFSVLGVGQAAGTHQCRVGPWTPEEVFVDAMVAGRRIWRTRVLGASWGHVLLSLAVVELPGEVYNFYFFLA